MRVINLKYEAQFYQFAMYEEGCTEVHNGTEMPFPNLTEDEVHKRISEEFLKWFMGRTEQVTCIPYPITKQQKSDWWVVMKSRPRILEVSLVDIPFQEDVDIAKTSRIDVAVQDIGPLVHDDEEQKISMVSDSET
ncbi:hypothetical protein M9H77_18349 [Catharanthus roseus]|uniref:Uncharacterized protein n=1 Tax=Catharanthus roseus TaxID=4058 RepID=A0ACC0B779_CATRO|nr:hypothetical protein M9H77_18349 [Catharanthus roseus]